jgi:hypothetical protein
VGVQDDLWNGLQAAYNALRMTFCCQPVLGVIQAAKCLQRAGKWPGVNIYLIAIAWLMLNFASR